MAGGVFPKTNRYTQFGHPVDESMNLAVIIQLQNGLLFQSSLLLGREYDRYCMKNAVNIIEKI